MAGPFPEGRSLAVEQIAYGFPFPGRELLALDKVEHKGHQRPLGQLLGQRLELPAGVLAPGQRGPEPVHELTAVALDEALVLQALEQLLDRAVLRGRPLRVEHLAEGASRQRPAL